MGTPPFFPKILIAVDDSIYSYNAAAYGFALARSFDSEVLLVHISEFPVTTAMTGDPIMGDPGIAIPDILDSQKEAAKALLSRLKDGLGPDLNVKKIILEGNIAEEVNKTAKEHHATLIVMGTHSRTGLSHFISGSIAERVTRHSSCPVLIVPTKDKKD